MVCLQLRHFHIKLNSKLIHLEHLHSLSMEHIISGEHFFFSSIPNLTLQFRKQKKLYSTHYQHHPLRIKETLFTVCQWWDHCNLLGWDLFYSSFYKWSVKKGGFLRSCWFMNAGQPEMGHILGWHCMWLETQATDSKVIYCRRPTRK